MNWNYVLIGVIAIAILLVIGYLVERWGVFEHPRADGAEQINRDDDESSQERPRIPIRDKPRQLPFELKIISGCLAALGGIIGFYAYQLLKNGSPTEFAYTTQAQYAVTALIGVVAGVAYRGEKDSSVGEVHVIYESGDGETVESEETIYFDRSSVAHQSDGSILVQELRDERIFGLFRRRKLAGHDRKLRSDRPLGDVVTHEIHSDAVQLDDGVWEMRTQEDKVVSGDKQAAADYRYMPPMRLPYEKQVKQQEQMRKMHIDMRSLRAQLAEAENELEELSRIIANREYQTERDIMNRIEEIADVAHV
jgi:hypothetical protein